MFPANRKKPGAEPIKLFQVVLRPPLSPASFYESIFHWLTGTAEQGNPSLHGLVDWLTDANMPLLSPDTDTVVTLTPLKESAGSGQTEKTCSESFASSIYFCDLTRCYGVPSHMGDLERRAIFQSISDALTGHFLGMWERKEISFKSFPMYIVFFFFLFL